MKLAYKPVGGVESVVLYPADAVQTALFSSEGCSATLLGEELEVALLDDGSYYEERAESVDGITKIAHRLHLVADRGLRCRKVSRHLLCLSCFPIQLI